MSRIDVENSKYREKAEHRKGDFTRPELLKARRLLRRLRFLETQMRINAKNDTASSAAIHTAEEADALEWALGRDGLDFLAPIKEEKQ
jgi:hypothetical protein